MIPKILHYCWFGKNEKPETFRQCLESWRLHCPDFEIKEWNENNSESFSNSFYKNALRKKKYAFAADYIRMKVLFAEGGIYLDTDMLVIKSLDSILDYSFIIGEEVPGRLNFAFFASQPAHPLVSKMIEFYDQNDFNPFSPPVISHTFSDLIYNSAGEKGDRIFGQEYFYALPYQNKDDDYSAYVTPNSLAIHLWEHSWHEVPAVTRSGLFKNLITVSCDYLFHGYSYAYFRRYFKEFTRKLWNYRG